MKFFMLKISVILFFFTAFADNGHAKSPQVEEQGIQFLNLRWEEALQKAQAENKLIFVDFYAEWCGRCKRLKENTFPDPEVGALFNKNFINLAFDIEKADGKALAEKYDVRRHPTLLFVNGQGEVVEQATGFQNTRRLIELGQTALAE
jgi:thioredoxin 1